LSRDVTEDELRLAFEEIGKVESAKIIKDKYSDESKGFGFVEMPSEDEGQSAIDKLNGKELKGRTLKVNEARPRTDNGGKRGYGGRREKRGFGNGKERGGYEGGRKGSNKEKYRGGGRSRGGDR
jgi:RNA recognition motif-containing protein